MSVPASDSGTLVNGQLSNVTSGGSLATFLSINMRLNKETAFAMCLAAVK